MVVEGGTTGPIRPLADRIPAGSRFWYHPTSAHSVVAHMIEEAAGQDYRRFIASRIMEPLGLGRFQLGVTKDARGT